MRISIPSIPESASTRKHVEYTIEAAVQLIAKLLQQNRGRTLLMTGAGVSVDSGIAPYRGADGHYTVHKTYRPIFYHEFVDESEKGHMARQRYWSRSFLGYPPVRECDRGVGKDGRRGVRYGLASRHQYSET